MKQDCFEHVPEGEGIVNFLTAWEVPMLHFPSRARTRVTVKMEPLEKRVLFALTLMDPTTQPKFVNPLPFPIPVLQPNTPGGTDYSVSVSQFKEDLGVRDPVTGAHLLTTVWGYNGSYPGPTIEAPKGHPDHRDVE